MSPELTPLMSAKTLAHELARRRWRFGSDDDVQACVKCGLMRAQVIYVLTDDRDKALKQACDAFTFCADCRVHHEAEVRRMAENHGE